MQPHHVNKKLISPLLFVLQEYFVATPSMHGIAPITGNMHRSLSYFERITSKIATRENINCLHSPLEINNNVLAGIMLVLSIYNSWLPEHNTE